MKKVILALAIVSVTFAACNSEEKKAETPAADTTAVQAAPAETPAAVADTTAAAAPVADTTKK